MEKMKKKKIYLAERVSLAFLLLYLFAAVMTVALWVSAADNPLFHVLSVCGTAFLGVGLLLFIRRVLRPYVKVQRLYRLYGEGFFSESMADYPIQINPVLESAEKKLLEHFDRDELLNLSKRQAEYLALQNQINPHFLYNTLESIRSEAILAGMDSVAEMTEALATFFRYTISKVDRLVTLEDELANVENYYMIQKYRFGDRLNLSIEYEGDDEMEALGCQIPKLTIQPLVENAIYHGLEQKIGEGHLRIRIMLTQKRLVVTVSDDGVGMGQEQLDTLNRKMRTAVTEDLRETSEKRGGIALLNVNNRIRLLFGEEYGLYFYSTPGVGTDVEATFPAVTNGNLL